MLIPKHSKKSINIVKAGWLKKNKPVSLKSLRKKAWALHSEYKRRKANGKCFTCNDQRDWKEQNAGHFIHKDCLDFDDIAIQCQCVGCNKWKSGNLGEFAIRLIKKYGIEAVEAIREKANINHKFTIAELEEKIEYYKRKLKKWENENALINRK